MTVIDFLGEPQPRSPEISAVVEQEATYVGWGKNVSDVHTKHFRRLEV